MNEKKFSLEDIYNAFRDYKLSKGKDGSFENFKTTYLYKNLTKNRK